MVPGPPFVSFAPGSRPSFSVIHLYQHQIFYFIVRTPTQAPDDGEVLRAGGAAISLGSDPADVRGAYLEVSKT